MDLRVARICGKFGLLPLHKSSRRPPSVHIAMKNTMKKFVVNAASSGESGRGRMVDEDMLVLRKRMYELRMEEELTNNIDVPPEEWTEWEKRWYPTYHSDVCSSLTWLQNVLLNTRPGVTLATLASISLSVPASLFLLLNISQRVNSTLSQVFESLGSQRQRFYRMFSPVVGHIVIRIIKLLTQMYVLCRIRVMRSCPGTSVLLEF